MSESLPLPDDSRLTAEQARDFVESQRAICETLITQRIISVRDIPPSLIDQVRVHVTTCQENHQPINGLMIEDE